MQIGASLRRLRDSTLLRNTLWMLLSQGGRLAIQAIYFVLIGRMLGPVGYGAFAGTAAFVAALVPFAGWGSGNVLIQKVAVDPTLFHIYWGNALVTIGLTSGFLVALAFLLGRLILPDQPVALLITIAISDLVFGRLLELAAQAYQAFEQLRMTALLGMLQGGIRLVTSLLFIATQSTPTVAVWAVWYLVATAVSAGVGLGLVRWQFGAAKPHVGLIPAALRDGWHFSVGLASGTVYSDIDKTMMARMAPLEAAGVYAAAYRAIAMAFVPVRALLYASYARFFQQGARGIRGSLSLAFQLLPLCAGYGLLACVGLLLTAPWAPLVLGGAYGGVVEVLRWLAPVPLLQSLHYVAADTLTGAGQQALRSRIQVAIAGLNVLLNLWLIPRYSWKGAVFSTLCTEMALVVALWLAVWLAVGRDRHEVAASGGREGHRRSATDTVG